MRHIISDLRGNPVYTSFGSWRIRNGNSGSSSRSNVTHHNPRSILFLNVKASNWNSVILRAKSHPIEILMFDDNGNTPLHVACQLDPPIEVLISLKDAVTQTNSWGATPLHIAVSHRCNVQALKKLIDYFPGALCRLSRMHRTPIHYACMSYRGLDLVAFQILLEQTIKESHRLQEEQQHHQQHNITQEHLSCDSKITDFIDILREAKDDIRGDNILDDEEISVLMIDSDSQHAVAASSSDLSSLPSSVNARRIFSNQIEEEENDAFGHDKNNYNVVTWKDTSGKTPLGLLFQRYRERVKRVIEILEQMKNSTPNRPRTSSSLQTDLGHLWGKARLIVVLLAEEQQQQQQQRHQKIPHSIGNIGATGKRDDDSSASAQHWSQAASWSKERLSNRHVDENSNKIKIDHNFDDKKMIPTEERQFRIVHASVGLTGYGCPPEMIRLAISIYPHQVREMDENGNLPLHIAAIASSLGTLASNNCVIDEESSVFSDSIVSLLSGMSSKKYGDGNYSYDSFDKVIKLLLKEYPQAAQTPHGRSGRLSLVLADRAGNRTWNDGMKTLLKAYPPAIFSGSKGKIPVKLYPNILSLIGGGNPSVISPPKGDSYIKHRTCSNSRLKGRGGIGLLHNVMLLKQRHVKELMARPSGTHNMYGNTLIGRRRNGRPYSDIQLFSNQSLLHHQNISYADNNPHSMNRLSSRSFTSPSKNNGGIRKQEERKKRKELATTLFELLRAKPDLIEASRPHQPCFKSDSYRKMSLAGDVLSPKNASESYHSDKPKSCEHQRSSRGQKKNTSRKLIEIMKVFEKKPRKSVQ